MIEKHFVTRKISLIQDELLHLEEYANLSFDEIAQDFGKQAIVERVMERIINRAIDINQHLISEFQGAEGIIPKGYKDTFTALSDLGVYSLELPAMLRQFKAFMAASRSPEESGAERMTTSSEEHGDEGTFFVGKSGPRRMSASRKLSALQVSEVHRRLTGKHKKARRLLRRELAAKFGVSLARVAAVSAHMTGKHARRYKRAVARRASRKVKRRS